jgi:hypothetical protein
VTSRLKSSVECLSLRHSSQTETPFGGVSEPWSKSINGLTLGSWFAQCWYMPTAETAITPILEPVRTIRNQAPRSRVARHLVVEAPRLIQAYISGTSGLGICGLLKSVSRGGLQVLTPIPVPVRSTVLVTIVDCCTVAAEVHYCIKKSTAFQLGIVFSTRHKPEIAVGAFAVICELEEPFTLTRGHVMDVGSDCLSILCKTKLTPNTWVRVESNGWVIFGGVEGVVASSMLASCVGIHLDAAFPTQFAQPASMLEPPGLQLPSENRMDEFEGANNDD